MDITIESYFDVMENERGDVMLVLKGREAEPTEDARFFFDGKEAALLQRRKDEIVLLTAMPEDVIGLLSAKDGLLIVETDEDGEGPQHVYGLPIEIVDELPLPDDAIQENTEEDAE